MKKIIFKGCGTAIATPFNENGVNYEEFEKLLEFQVENGADAIIVCGTTGEASTMTDSAGSPKTRPPASTRQATKSAKGSVDP